MAGIRVPIVIAAATREKARQILTGIIAQSQILQKSEILDETVERPTPGVTTLRMNGAEYVWDMDREGTQGWRKRLGN